ncbi:uncharacterized protein LOC110266948 [Arachis ipaensis]|uniref:uncharacterized protein LOC110266948 n=1 Tax=Arachis ipaensis TaxID=130454 RepID=UPI000A2B212D|nr:uncharacterized protein LOC110266948 [Arachis ipaensis]
MKWKWLTSVIEIRSFLSLAKYYRRFIKRFLQLALSLTKLTRKDTPFVWTPECEESFQALKYMLTVAPVLVLPEQSEPFEVYCDASLKGLECVLMQHQNVVAYASRKSERCDGRLESEVFICSLDDAMRGTVTKGISRFIKTVKRYVKYYQQLNRKNSGKCQKDRMLRKYIPNTSHVLEPKPIQVREDLTLPVIPVRIDNTSVKRLRGRKVSLVKAAWSRAGIEEHTWKLESDMRKNYPHLFSGN